MTPAAFIAKWKRAELSERAASQEHFLDLCKLLGVKTPAELDPIGDTFTFEKGVAVTGPASAGSGGQRGFADVWYKGRFGWEYKRKGKYATLTDALRQLQQYRDALANPPLLIVSDIAQPVRKVDALGAQPHVHLARGIWGSNVRRKREERGGAPHLITPVLQDAAQEVGRREADQGHGVRVLWRTIEHLRVVLLNDLPAGEHRHLVRQRHCLDDIRGHVQHARAGRGSQTPQVVDKLLA